MSKEKLNIYTMYPLTKFTLMGSFILLLNLFPQPIIYLCLLVFILLISTKIKKKKTFFKRVIVTNVVLFVPMLVMQILFKPGQDVLWSWFIFNVSKESMTFAFLLFFRLCLTCGLILLFFHITEMKDFAISLEQTGVPTTVTYIFLSTMLLIPQTIARYKNILQAQQVRGIETEGSIMIRIKAFIPIITPLILTSLMSTEERSLALETRSFFSTNQKTYLNSPKKDRWDQLIIKSFLIGCLLLIMLKMVIVWKK